MGFDDFDLKKMIPYQKVFSHIKEYHLDPKYKKPLIDGLILDIGSPIERDSKEEILIYCEDLCSLGHWTA